MIVATAAGAGIAVVALIAWMFARTQARIQRLWCASWIWICGTLIAYLFRG